MPQKKLPFILVIDDSPIVCRVLEAVLRHEGYEVTSFEDPVLALRAIFTTGTTPLPDLLIVDVVLPRMDGYHVIQYVHQHPMGQAIPIMILSRLDSVTDRLKGTLAGATAYLTKPFVPRLVIDVVRQLLAGEQPT